MLWLPFKLSLSSLFIIVVKSCPTLCNTMDCSPPGPSVHGISRLRITGITLPGWVGCHFLLWGIFLTYGLNLHILHWQADSFATEPPGKSIYYCHLLYVFNLFSEILKSKKKSYEQYYQYSFGSKTWCDWSSFNEKTWLELTGDY